MKHINQTAMPEPPAGFALPSFPDASRLMAPPAAQTSGDDDGAQAPSPKSNLEEWLGRNAIGVVASVLVFAGLVMLGATVVPQLTDTLKVVFMFTLSGVLSVAGSLLAVFKRNNFTMALMGCGMGSLFISVLATHVYFGLIGEVAAFGLILLWMVACLALIRKTGSLLLAIVLQLGLACSVCLAYSSNLDGGKLALVVGYQLVASVIVVGGNLLFFRKLYRTSLFLALGLGVVASLYMWGYFGFDLEYWVDEYPLIWVIVAFAVQFATASALSAMLVKSIGEDWCERTRNHDLAEKLPKRQRVQLVCVTLLAILAVRLDVYNVVERCLRAAALGNPFSWKLEFLYAVAVASFAMVVLLGLMALALVMFAKRGFNAAPSRENAAGAGDAQAFGPVPAASLNAAFTVEEHRWLNVRLVKPSLDALVMAAVLTLAYFVAYCSFVDEAVTLGWMWVVALGAVALWKGTADASYRTAALVLVLIDGAFLATLGFSDLQVRLDLLQAALLGAAYVIGLGVLAGALVRSSKPDTTAIVAFAVWCTCLLMSYLYHCTPLAGEGYQWSICCMACGLACVIAGFVLRVDGLRLYGLILALACVLKLVLLDMADLDSLARVCALIVGGAICFGISALYNFAVKRLA